MKTRDFINPDTSNCSGIYKITQRNTGHIYVGSAINIYSRCEVHLSCLRNKRHPNRKLQADADKFGLDSFEFEILEVTPRDETVLNEREAYWQNHLGSNQYYNQRRTSKRGTTDRKCQICGDSHYANDLCSRHYHWPKMRSWPST